MAIPYSNPSTKKLLLELAGFFVLLTLKVSLVEAFSFNFPNFTDDGSLILQGDAKIWADGKLALPTDPAIANSTSRAVYAEPLTIWDSKTGKVASFVTSFSFVVDDYEDYNPADGLVFFLAPWKSDIPPNSVGGSFGILDAGNGYNQFVAVEFDSFVNTWDPNSRHIGIDVNSVISLTTVPWSRVTGSLEKVNIAYDSQTKTLSVVVTHQNGEISTIAQVIDLKAVLPEKVSIGLSATLWDTDRERYFIYSWSFTSTLNTKRPLVI